jgi:hypothetical protein
MTNGAQDHRQHALPCPALARPSSRLAGFLAAGRHLRPALMARSVYIVDKAGYAPATACRKPAAKTACPNCSKEIAMLFQRDVQTLRAGCPSRPRGLGKILFFAFFFCPLIFLFASGCITNPPKEASVSLAAVRVDGKWGYIDANGREVIPPRFDRTWGFTGNGLAAVAVDNKWGYIDASGREVIPLRYDLVFGFSPPISIPAMRKTSEAQ